MAADWIKMRADLHRDPAVVSIARACKLDAFAVVGRLHAVWAWADGVTEDGVVDGVDAELLDEIAGRKWFAAAMAATPRSPWLVIRDGGVAFPHFDRHNGQSAKRRALERDRKVSERAADADKRPESVRNPSASNADEKRTRRDETREDEIQRESDGPSRFKAAWCRKYREARGSPYVWLAQSDGEARSAVQTFPDETDLHARVHRYLTVPDAFLDKVGRSLTVFLQQANTALVRGIEPEQVRREPQPAYLKPFEPDKPVVNRIDPEVRRRMNREALEAAPANGSKPPE